MLIKNNAGKTLDVKISKHTIQRQQWITYYSLSLEIIIA